MCKYHVRPLNKPFDSLPSVCVSANRCTCFNAPIKIGMPVIAFSSLNNDNTKGDIGVIEGLISQTLCGVVFALTAGQPLTIIRTTGPLTVYIAVLYSLTTALNIPFLPFYAWTGKKKNYM